MITGETEQLLDDFLRDDYDDFFGNRKKRRVRRAARKAKRLARRQTRRSQPKRIERREKRKRFLKDVGKVYHDLGGATGIGTIIDSVTRPQVTMPNGTDIQEPTDYTIDIGAQSEPEAEKKSIPTVVYVLGGVVVVGVIGLAVMSKKNNASYTQYPH